MKKIISIFVITLISLIILPFSVQAANIVSLDVESNNGKLTVSGTSESDVHAIAVLVYSENNLVHMETCAADENYSCELNKNFADGTYQVKVADYDGGDYLTKEITIENNNENNPITSDNIVTSIIIGSISIISLIGCGLYINKKRNSNL